MSPDERIPESAITTPPDVARRCTLCGHHECPCCDGFCDACFEVRPGDGGAEVWDDGERLRVRWPADDGSPGEEELVAHKRCIDQGTCTYDRPRDARIAELVERADKLWPSGGAFGVTEDGRVWFAPSRCTSSCTFRDDEHRTYDCELDVDHDDAHRSGDAMWTDSAGPRIRVDETGPT